MNDILIGSLPDQSYNLAENNPLLYLENLNINPSCWKIGMNSLQVKVYNDAGPSGLYIDKAQIKAEEADCFD